MLSGGIPSDASMEQQTVAWQQRSEASSPPSTSPDPQLDLAMAKLALGGCSKAQEPSLAALPVARHPDVVQDASPGDVEDSESDEDVDKYRLAVNSEVARLPSANRRRGDAAFQSWIRESQRSNNRAATDASARAFDRVSMARLIQSNEDRKIIATPREYQIDLFERAKQKNLIIVLDTG